MKKLVAAALAALTIAGPMTASLALADPPYGGDRDHYGGDRDHRDGDRDHRDGDGDRRDGDRDWRHDRSEWRDERADARWDRDRHNGYWFNNQWYFGPPPDVYYGRSGFSLGYRPWARGALLPRYYFADPYFIDWRAYHLHRPPHGYRWVRDERGDLLLAAIATGIIADVIIQSR